MLSEHQAFFLKCGSACAIPTGTVRSGTLRVRRVTVLPGCVSILFRPLISFPIGDNPGGISGCQYLIHLGYRFPSLASVWCFFQRYLASCGPNHNNRQHQAAAMLEAL